jgi:hypothetical protein
MARTQSALVKRMLLVATPVLLAPQKALTGPELPTAKAILGSFTFSFRQAALTRRFHKKSCCEQSSERNLRLHECKR